MNSLWHDIRYAVRVLAKQPGFTLVVVLTLALGIGANTAIFSVVNAVILEPLPFSESQRLVAVQGTDVHLGDMHRTLSYPDFADFRAQNRTLESVGIYDRSTSTLTGSGEPLHIDASIVSANVFDILRAQPLLGRTFIASEDQPGTRVAILSHHLWTSHFGASPDIVGRTIILDAKAYTVVGVMPASFQFLLTSQPPELWTTVGVEMVGNGTDPPMTSERGAHFLSVIGRLKPGVSIDQANADANAIGASLEKQYPDSNGHLSLTVHPQIEAMVGDVRPVLMMVLGAVGFLLLIACSNAANLLLARAAGRQREMAIRASMGAGRARVLRQLLTESVLLALAGGLLGLFLAVWGTTLLASIPSLQIPRLAQAGIDLRVLAFTLGVSVLTGVLFGMAPAWHASRFNLFLSLKEGGRASSDSKRASRARNILVVAQVSLAVILLVGASLLVESMVHLTRQSPGFDPNGVMVFNLDLPDARYGKPEQSILFFRELLERVRAVPGVQSASAVLPLPMGDDIIRTSFEIEGRPVPKSEEPRVHFRIVAQDYIKTMRIPLISGRDFTPRDQRTAAQVVLINETLARRYFPNENPIGKHIKPGVADVGEEKMREIVGVVGDVHHRNLWQATDAECYVPYDQVALGAMNIVVRAQGEPMSLLPAIREQVRAVDTELPVYKARDLRDYVEASVAQRKFTSMLVSVFAAAGLLLATVGLFGLISYSVAQRRNEIGIRVAVGAERGDIIGMVLRSGITLALAGVVVGLAGTLAISRVLKNQLFGVSATDPLTFIGVALALIAVATAACYIPAWRAANADPLTALRNE
ncbi:MAG TPA: ABC transporter permease [Candidatus Acidoferrum sp.]|nr:ABC transporter permease [Candidatus Acidoferrum sp.]